MNGNAEFDECARRGGKGGRKRRVGVEGEERAQKVDLLKDEEEKMPVCHHGGPRIHSYSYTLDQGRKVNGNQSKCLMHIGYYT